MIRLLARIAAALFILLFLSALALRLILHEKKPQGISGPEAERIAYEMVEHLNVDAYRSTDIIEWYMNGRKYRWNKLNQRALIEYDSIAVVLNISDYKKSRVEINGVPTAGHLKSELSENAYERFINDSFWVFAPFKVFDQGTKRSTVTLDNGKTGLMVEYTSGGVTPGDSYLWHLDSLYRPTGFQMWTKIIPIGGIYASWEDWTTTETDVLISQKHKVFFYTINIDSIQAFNVP